ncbi:MAG: SDR family NAD(P)-dependent oxidoreductase [Actinomycetia bacterium]|nr:SDR family NAD(P)-dependent oxidoreductase [Actinomycetes bacterium]
MNRITEAMGSVSRTLSRPTGAGRYRPLYFLNILDKIRGASLENAVRDRVVLITGASSGIGAVTAKQIGAAGGTVALVARGIEKLEATAEEVRAAGGTAHIYPCDLSDLDAIEAMTDKALADLGRVDILVNNAGRSIRRSLELSYDRMHDYQRTMQLNYFAPVQLMLKVLPGMRERKFGHVVNVSSVGVQTRVPRFGAYIASKAALDILCDAWQAETHSDNVRFTTVHMGLVRTPMIEATTIYDQFPVLTPEQAADTLCEAIIHRPRRSTSPVGQIASFADAVTPQIMDRVRSRGFDLFDDSAAAKGKESAGEEQISTQGKVFAEVTRGVHW